MRYGDVTFFAPDIPFSDIDLTGDTLPRQLCARMEGYYLRPADDCIDLRHAFAAGLLAVTCLDAMSRFAHSPNRRRRSVGKDFCSYARGRLKSFSSAAVSDALYDDFRNGLVHEARLKRGAQFVLGMGHAIEVGEQGVVIDAGLLVGEVRASIYALVDEMDASQRFRDEMLAYIKATFQAELAVAHP